MEHYCSSWLTPLLLLSFLLLLPLNGAQQEEPCQILDGGSHLIIALNESRGSDYSQVPFPKELSLQGVIGVDIDLELSEDDSHLFLLQGKEIRLKRPLDRDAQDLSSISLKITCTSLTDGKRQTIPLVVRVLDLNDNPPLLKGTPYMVEVPENTAVNSVIFSGLDSMDIDANINGQVEYRLIGNESNEYFAIESPYQGIITLAKQLDFERSQKHFVKIQASDRAINPDDRFSATTTLTVKVTDSDDLPPVFSHPEGYTAEVISGYPVSNLRIEPNKIHAFDQDTLRSPMSYSFVDGSPDNFRDYFKIHPETGLVSQKEVIHKSDMESLQIVVQAEEDTGRFSVVGLSIFIASEDKNPPVLSVSASVGYVDEGAEIGTYVTDSDGERISFSIVDKDVGEGREALSLDLYDIEMTSKFFQVDEDGFLIVREGDIDRDPPFQPVLNFQIFVKEKSEPFKSSSPLQLSIQLRDINDNPPVFAPISDVSLIAGSNRRTVAALNATDKDSDKFVVYKLLGVSNNGRSKFSLDPKSGLLEVVAPLKDGEVYSLSIEARDNGGLSSVAVVRLNVRPMPNLHKPMFDRFLYDVEVSEGAHKFTSVLQALAKDPEKSPLTYDIIGGNELGHFTMEESTGVIRVMSPLDRESIAKYNMTLKANDLGGKFGLSSLQITVTDENDNDPIFQDLPYSFRVSEGISRKFVGKAVAIDADEGANGNISYFFHDEVDDESFTIEKDSGKIFTAKQLDFETQSVHYLIIGARDNGVPQRDSSATATVLIQDVSDEVPYFDVLHSNVSVPENEPDTLIAQVTAIDPDTEPSITYRLIDGDRSKFKVDPKTGEIFAPIGLDYERTNFYKLTIGTEEGFLAGRFEGDAITIVDVYVQDKNDIPPTFDKVPYGQTLIVRDDAGLNEKIGSLSASDSSGSSPIDSIGFRLSSKGSSKDADQFFSVDERTGDIIVIGDLKADQSEEHQLEVEAYSTPIPTLSSYILIRIMIKHLAPLSTELGIGFEKTAYSIEMMENAKKDSVVLTLPVSRKMKKKSAPFKCALISIDGISEFKTTDEKLFTSRVNENKNCELILRSSGVDREKKNRHNIILEIQSHPEFINSERQRVSIDLHVLDVNDNAPKFQERQYFGIIHLDSEPMTPIMQIVALDNDAGVNGEVKYYLQSKNNLDEAFFEIDPVSGIIVNSLRLKDFNGSLELPFHFLIIAQDEAHKNPLQSSAYVVINLLDIETNDLILTLPDISPNEFEPHRDALTSVLQESTGYKVGVDKADTVYTKYLNGSCCTSMHGGTDVYFHVIDPIQYRVLNSSEPKVETYVLNKAPSIKKRVSQRLNLRVSDLHRPYESEEDYEDKIQAAGFGVPGPFSYFSIVIGLSAGLFVLALLAIVYLFCAKRRLQMALERKERMIVVPRYEPIVLDSPQKEYETQVLQMNVPFGGAEEPTLRLSSPDFPSVKEMDFGHQTEHSGGQFFNMENVSYITKEDILYS